MLPRPLPASATFCRRSIIFILVVMVCSAPILADQPKPIKPRRSRSMRTFVRSCLTLVLHVMVPTKMTIHQACGWTASKWQPKRLSFSVRQNHPPFFNGSPTTPTQCRPKSFAISCRITKKPSSKNGSTKGRSTRKPPVDGFVDALRTGCGNGKPSWLRRDDLARSLLTVCWRDVFSNAVSGSFSCTIVAGTTTATLKKTSPSRQAYATAPARPSLKTSSNADC